MTCEEFKTIYITVNPLTAKEETRQSMLDHVSGCENCKKFLSSRLMVLCVKFLTRMKWYFLSFSEERWLGCCYVMAESAEQALIKSAVLGCNPGGAVVTIPVGEEPPPDARNRLITSKEELEKLTGLNSRK